jgi:protein-L-isoaspartate O-methyltransferase
MRQRRFTASHDEVGRVERLVIAARRAGADDPRVLDAIRRVPRAAFVPFDQIEMAYYDEPVRIPHGQVTTQPSLSARMIQALGLAEQSTSWRSAQVTATRLRCWLGWHRL